MTNNGHFGVVIKKIIIILSSKVIPLISLLSSRFLQKQLTAHLQCDVSEHYYNNNKNNYYNSHTVYSYLK